MAEDEFPTIEEILRTPEKSENIEWTPSFMYGEGVQFTLSENQRLELEAQLKEIKNRITSDEVSNYLSNIEQAIFLYLALKKAKTENNLGKVKKRIVGVRDLSKKLIIAIAGMEDSSRHLMNTYGGASNIYRSDMNMREIIDSLKKLHEQSESVLSHLDKFRTRGRTTDFERKQLAHNVFKALNELSISITSNPNGEYARILILVMEYAGIPTKENINGEDRDVEKLIKNAIKDFPSYYSFLQTPPPELNDKK